MTISPEALEKARAITHMFCLFPPSDKQALEIQIATALQAAHDAAAPKLPDDLAGLVKELRDAAHLNAGPLGPEARAEHRALTTIQSLVARIAELEAGLHGLLNCPDIADNDYKDEETHAAERVARSLLNKDRQP
jgi:hypothetical protein